MYNEAVCENKMLHCSTGEHIASESVHSHIPLMMKSGKLSLESYLEQFNLEHLSKRLISSLISYTLPHKSNQPTIQPDLSIYNNTSPLKSIPRYRNMCTVQDSKSLVDFPPEARRSISHFYACFILLYSTSTRGIHRERAPD